jgi:hypothetical protein
VDDFQNIQIIFLKVYYIIMSIVTLKKKTGYKYNNSSVGHNQFSLKVPTPMVVTMGLHI